MIDVKGEYGPLAEALGPRTIRFEPGGEVRLNSIERRGGHEVQLALLRSGALAALRRDLAPEQDAALRVAVRNSDPTPMTSSPRPRSPLGLGSRASLPALVASEGHESP